MEALTSMEPDAAGFDHGAGSHSASFSLPVIALLGLASCWLVLRLDPFNADDDDEYYSESDTEGDSGARHRQLHQQQQHQEHHQRNRAAELPSSARRLSASVASLSFSGAPPVATGTPPIAASSQSQSPWKQTSPNNSSKNIQGSSLNTLPDAGAQTVLDGTRGRSATQSGTRSRSNSKSKGKHSKTNRSVSDPGLTPPSRDLPTGSLPIDVLWRQIQPPSTSSEKGGNRRRKGKKLHHCFSELDEAAEERLLLSMGWTHADHLQSSSDNVPPSEHSFSDSSLVSHRVTEAEAEEESRTLMLAANQANWKEIFKKRKRLRSRLRKQFDDFCGTPKKVQPPLPSFHTHASKSLR